MKISSKMLALVAILGVFAAASVAQEAGPQGGGVAGGKGGRQGGGGRGMMRMDKEHMKELMDALKLTADQKKRLEILQKKNMEQMQAFRKENKNTTDRQALREKAMKMRQEHNKAIMDILTPEQEKIYKAKMKEMFDKMRKERGAGKPPVS